VEGLKRKYLTLLSLTVLAVTLVAVTQCFGVSIVTSSSEGKGIPTYVKEKLDKLRFYDEGFHLELSRRVVYHGAAEGDWRTWLIGYGIPGNVINDIIVDLGYNTVTGTVAVTIAKLAYNPISVYYNDVFVATIPEFTGPAGEPVAGVLWLELT